MKPAYYNEIDPHAAKTLRNLIEGGFIAPGDVDERSIEDVRPIDLKGYAQCHFFAGIGVWSHALRQAGWEDSRPVWTASCPCQPFSAAGKGNGFDDERHLWPHLHWLIEQRRPAKVFGEQVASKDAEPWIDLVQADLEALGYAFGCVPFPSAGIGAPHIRDRAYWVGDTRSPGLEGWGSTIGGEQWALRHPDTWGAISGVANTKQYRSGRETPPANPGQSKGNGPTNKYSGHSSSSIAGSGPVNGIWRDADWLLCRDGKWRPVEPGTFPLAHGAPARVGRLRAYGNAINAEAATTFIKAYRDISESL